MFFYLSFTTWIPKQQIDNPSTDSDGNIFGHSTAFCHKKHLLFVGAEWEGPNRAGAVYIYQKHHFREPYNFLQKIEPPPNSEIGCFGSSLAISRTCGRLLVGAPCSNKTTFSRIGAVLTYDIKSIDNYTYVHKTTTYPSTLESDAGYGRHLVASNNANTYAVAATNKISFQTDKRGAVYVHEVQVGADGEIQHPTELKPDFYNGVLNRSKFGSDLQFIDASTLLVATHDVDTNAEFPTLLYKRGIDGWVKSEELTELAPSITNVKSYGQHISMPIDTQEIIAVSSDNNILIVHQKRGTAAFLNRQLTQIITLPDGYSLSDMQFCRSHLIAVTDSQHRNRAGIEIGAVLIYEKGPDSHYQLSSVLSPPDEKPFQGFGSSISFADNCKELWVGAQAKEGPSGGHRPYTYGKVYLYEASDRTFINTPSRTEIYAGLISGAAFILVLIGVAVVFAGKRRQRRMFGVHSMTQHLESNFG